MAQGRGGDGVGRVSSAPLDIYQGFLIKSIFPKLSVIGRKLFFQQLYNILIIKFKLF